MTNVLPFAFAGIHVRLASLTSRKTESMAVHTIRKEPTIFNTREQIIGI
jgi:hypothetical protein